VAFSPSSSGALGVVSYVMTEAQGETPAVKLRMVFHLVDVAERMLRQRLRRECPEMSGEDIEQQVVEWYGRRPGAEFGDGEGRPARWPRR
jgi:hypothetical protein